MQLLGWLSNVVSRRFEFQADGFGVELGRGEQLREALVTRDRALAYRVDDGIPVLLAEEGMATAQAAGFPGA